MGDVYSVPRKTAGLNNLKMAILGIKLIAAAKGGAYRLPEVLFDFTPTQDGIGDDYLPTEAVFDIEALTGFFADATTDPETIRTSNSECLDIVKREIASELGMPGALHGETAKAFASFVPSVDLRAESARIASLLPADTVALQVRIERDWQEYVARKGWQAGTVSDGCEIILDHKRIFQKMAATDGLPKTVFACCDEDDLTVSHDQLRADARSVGFDLIFKSDFESPIIPRLMKSVVDFDVCLNLPFYVGLPRSTFSNTLCMVRAHQIDGHPLHFVFDAVSERCERRQDYGRASNSEAATRK
jgi:hypothetical protein